MNQPIMVGCDLHDQTMLLKIARGREKAQTLSVKNTAAGRAQMIAQLKSLADCDEVLLVYEASGQGFGLHDQLTEAGIQCFVLAPTKLTRSPQQKRQKTDEKDAEDLLELLRGHQLAGNRLPKVWIPDPQTRDDRELVRTRLDAADKLSAVKVQTKGLLKRNALTRPEGLGSGYTRLYVAWLRGLVQQSERGAGFRGALDSLLRQVKFLEEEVDRLTAELSRLAAAPRYAARLAELTKLKGVGPLTALVFLSELGNLNRFENRRQISAYLGLAPSSFESGQASDRKGHITHQGPSRVRRVLCQATWARVRTEASAKAAYQRIAEKNPKRKKIAVVAAMRKLAVLMWHRGKEASCSANGAQDRPPGCRTPVLLTSARD